MLLLQIKHPQTLIVVLFIFCGILFITALYYAMQYKLVKDKLEKELVEYKLYHNKWICYYVRAARIARELHTELYKYKNAVADHVFYPDGWDMAKITYWYSKYGIKQSIPDIEQIKPDVVTKELKADKDERAKQHKNIST